MSVFEHNPRARIFNPAQHPLTHDISSFAYSNGALPGISLLGDALDYIVAFMYPNYKGTVATPAALPGSGTANDYYLVSDDGDGKAAGYVWIVRENGGEWMKRYDVDWSYEQILSETVNRTQYMYVHKFGMADADSTGSALTGINAGQHVYGGVAAGSHLTLHANSANADTTGFVQVADNFVPQVDSTHSLGTTLLRWLNFFTDSLTSGTCVITGGSITDTSGAISFDNENLTTTGTFSAATVTGTTSGTFGTCTISGGSITDSSGAISFGNENLSTTGTFTAATGYFTSGVEVGPLVGDALILGAGSITDESGAISFGNENLTTTGTFSAATVTGTTSTAGGNLLLSANTLSSTNVNGSIVLDPNGTGNIDLSAATTLAASITAASGTWTITAGQFNVDNLRLDGNTLSSTDVNGNVIVDPNGSGLVELGAAFFPTTDSTWDIGKTGSRWNDLWLDGNFQDGTNVFTVAEFMTLKSANWRDAGRTQAVQAGDTLFWSGTQWLASVPDTEIAHSAISGLTTTDAGHTQFVMLAGRSGGQTVQGGTAASEDLILESTAHATKGTIQLKDDTHPFADASYSGSWSGVDLGSSSFNFVNIYSKGEHIGLRLENLTSGTLPTPSGQNVGRIFYTTDTFKVYIDTGSALRQVGGGGGGGGSVFWVEDTNSPTPAIENNIQVYEFDPDTQQELYALIKVPQTYTAGEQIFLHTNFYSTGTSGTVLLLTQSTLIREETDVMSTTTNQRTSTNSAITLSAGTASEPQIVTCDLTDSSGQINGVAAAPGDLIKVKIYRDVATDTSTVVAKAPVYGAEFTFAE